MIHAALIGPAQQYYSHLSLKIRKNWPAFPKFSKDHDNQRSQTQAKILLESIIRATGERIKKLALRTEQLT